MELSESIEPFLSPIAEFVDYNDSEVFKAAQLRWLEKDLQNDSSSSWASSAMNPSQRVDDLKPGHEPRWQIYGCAGLGRRFFALPTFMMPELPVKKIDIIVPCQSKHPPAIRRTLDSSAAYNAGKSAIIQMDFHRHILQILDEWTTRLPYFRQIYTSLPFGSTIVLEDIQLRPSDITPRILLAKEVHSDCLTLGELHQLWASDELNWPQQLNLSQLRHCAQLHDSVSMVEIPSRHGATRFIFKNSIARAKYIYHELKMLLSMGKHPHILPRPLYLVVDDESPRRPVTGFLLEYFAGGTLRDKLERNESIVLQQKLNWAVQTVQALQHVHNSPARFYSELKPDNVLLTHSHGDIVLIDFEQSGNWDTFAAPEIFYRERLSRLLHSDHIGKAARDGYMQISRHLGTPFKQSTARYDNPPNGYYEAWNGLMAHEREAAMVYSLGKVLWCIFEELSHTENSINERYSLPVRIEFPTFESSPEVIQRLILACTAGSPSHHANNAGIVREGGMVYPRDRKKGAFFNKDASPASTLETAKSMWREQNNKMTAFLAATLRYQQGTASDMDISLLGYPNRPTLQEVSDILTTLR